MEYRDDLAAAHERIEKLESELAESRAENERLKTAAIVPAERPAKIAVRARPREPRSVGGLTFHPPPTYVPHLRRYARFVRIVIEGRPTKERPSSDRLIDWIGHVLALPLVYGLWLPAYCVVSCFVVPYIGLQCVLATPFVVLWKLLSGLRVGTSRSASSEADEYREPTDKEAASMLLLVMFPFPPLATVLPLYARVLDEL